MAKQKKQQPEIDEVYTYRSINRTFASSLVVTCCVVFGMMALSIYTELLKDTHWTVIALPICIFGSLLVFFPPVEEWVYKPWQRQAERVEHHNNDY